MQKKLVGLIILLSLLTSLLVPQNCETNFPDTSTEYQEVIPYNTAGDLPPRQDNQ